MSEETKQIFKQQLLSKKQQSKRKLKVKKVPRWIIPTAYYRQYKKIIKTILDKYISITLNMFPLLEKWDRESRKIKDNANDVRESLINILNPIEKEKKFQSLLGYRIRYYKLDSWEEELEIEQEEYNKVFENNKTYLKSVLLSMGVLISAFNKKQWIKITEQSLGIESFVYESWEKSFLNTWVLKNVNLIKGLTDEYKKKIIDTIITGSQDDKLTVSDLKSKLQNINKTFSDYRSELIAKDQVNKINNQLAEQRQKDAGVETFEWVSSRDERVRESHAVMEGMLCRWDNENVYSDDNGVSWKSRSSIGGVNLQPGQDINCRCVAEPNFENIISEINQ